LVLFYRQAGNLPNFESGAEYATTKAHYADLLATFYFARKWGADYQGIRSGEAREYGTILFAKGGR
jgi:L-fucose mutarotase/ribose pyranase (RbsD/FucU family)